jgi:hypothetical protein
MIVVLAAITVLQTTGSSAQADTLDDDDAGLSLVEMLNVGLPIWDASINKAPFDVQEVAFMDNPWNIAPLVSESSFTFKELRSNGRVVYQGDRCIYKYNPETGYWKFISEPTLFDGSLKNPLTDEEAKKRAEALFDELGLPESEKGEVFAAGIGGAGMGPSGETAPIRAEARHVRIYRRINDMRVLDSHLMMTYNLDGTVARMEVRWPSFRLEEEMEPLDRDSVISDLAQEIAERFGNTEDIKEINARAVYWYDEENDLFEPTLMLGFGLANGEVSPLNVRYSLLFGKTIFPEVSAGNL